MFLSSYGCTIINNNDKEKAVFFLNKLLFIILFIIVFLLNRTEPNFWSGSGSVHQSKGLFRVRFGSSNLSSGSGSVRFNHVMLYFISKKKSVTIASVRKSFFAATKFKKIVFSSTEILFSLR